MSRFRFHNGLYNGFGQFGRNRKYRTEHSSREALDEVAVKGKGEVPPVGEDSLEAAGIGGVDEPFNIAKITKIIGSFDNKM
ncbi:hypothetical protein RIR_jg4019.t1 [Rhizophagus irregularis DAOM 181602=DAOM 197198]|nr:hypothetical protein RIR_jg4019.t1 [Rhizophagus irregularis DAOM 181602=DAOM 197198]